MTVGLTDPRIIDTLPYRHPRIKRENPRRGFELSECFLVDFFIVGRPGALFV